MQAVRDISLDVGRGEFLVITGRSGSGKTTLLHLAAGLTKPTTGRVQLDGVDLWSMGEKERSSSRSQKIGFAFQFPSLLPSLTTLENVTLPTFFCAPKGKLQGRRRAQELLEQIGLKDKFDALPRQLSGGQQQRVVIARALINEPEILLADEPTSNLDEETEREIMELFKSIHASTGITILLVTHTSQLIPYGTRSIRMSAGRLEPTVNSPSETTRPQSPSYPTT
ncbi:MAG: ABC transporter ATP-binding protein [Chloroflexi bacterium]|nr:ABC transporter ATP-binding protein [Chloroflexota bacterium]